MRVGFVGLGNMGWPMAANLAAAGFEVVAYDADKARLAAFGEETGAEAAEGLGQVGGCDAAVTMLPTGADVRAVLTQAEGGAFLAAARKGLLAIDMSTSEPEGTRALARELAERGVALVDAPVSGGAARAKAGELAIMAGADDADALTRARPILGAMGTRIFETGGSGTGHAVKALNNMVAGTTYAVLCEAVLAARRFGLDEETLIEVMDASTGHSFFTQHVMRQHVANGAFATGFSIGLLAKDMGIAADLARDLAVDSPVLAAARERWIAARDDLGPSADNTAAITSWEKGGA